MKDNNKYNQYVSQAPTNGDQSTRAAKRRNWFNGWDDFKAVGGKMNYMREARRNAWRDAWAKFRDMKEEIILPVE